MKPVLPVLLGVVWLLMLECSGFAQPAKSGPGFYVVLNSLTKSCTVVDKTPRTDTPHIPVASDAIYQSRAEAYAGILGEGRTSAAGSRTLRGHGRKRALTALPSPADLRRSRKFTESGEGIGKFIACS